MRINELREKPRERLEMKGPNSLSDAELLAIILSCGTQNKNALDLANEILQRFTLDELMTITRAQLERFKGVGEVKSIQLLAVIELAKRISSSKQKKRVQITSSKEVADMFCAKICHLDKEHLIALYLNQRNYILAEETISIGTVNASLLHPREICKPAITNSASKIILIHNHPSNDPTPSQADLIATAQVLEATKVLGIKLEDHIILARDNYYSFKEEELL